MKITKKQSRICKMYVWVLMIIILIPPVRGLSPYSGQSYSGHNFILDLGSCTIDMHTFFLEVLGATLLFGSFYFFSSVEIIDKKRNKNNSSDL